MDNKTFFESIGYEPYQEIRVMMGDYWKSFYPKNYIETSKIIEKYKRFNCYVGINPRKNKGQKSEDVMFRRMMVFDLEMMKKKPVLSDPDYQDRLKTGISIVKEKVYEIMGCEVTWIVSSGRGIHLYYRLERLDNSHQDTYVFIYNRLVSSINRRLKTLGLKVDPPVKDLPRIFGCPGTRNTKYDEPSAIRNILHHNDVTTDINGLIEKVEKKIRQKESEIQTRKLSLKGLRKRPEYQIFQYKPLNGVNNRLRFPLKLLMREAGFSEQDTEKISCEIRDMGFSHKPMYLGLKYPNIRYSKKIIQNYCIDNYRWCVDVGFPYPYKEKDKKCLFSESDDKKDFPKRNISSWEDTINFVIEFNKATMERFDSDILFFTKSLEEHLKICCEERLWKFIDESNLFQEIKYRIENQKIFIDDCSEFIEVKE
jgi:hypothetical protein